MEVLVLGGTGLVGSELLRQLRADPTFTTIHAPDRKELASALPPDIQPETVFCCLGTTIKAAGSQEAFQEVDHWLPIRIARETLNRGARQFVVVSAMGADAHSRIFYNRVKGLMESDLQTLGYPVVVILHPSLLMGDRKVPRLGEQIASFFMTVLKFIIPRKWRAVHVRKVASTMIDAVKNPANGTRVIENDGISESK